METDPIVEEAPTVSSWCRTTVRVVVIFGLVVVGFPFASKASRSTVLAYFSGIEGIEANHQLMNYTTLSVDDDRNVENRKIKVACVGDSITERGCVTNMNDTYVSQLSSILGSDYEVTNFGHSGQTMFKGGMCCRNDETWPCSYWNTPEFLAATTSAPDIVTIMLGTNDAKRCNWYGPPDGSPKGVGHEYILDYTDMLELFWSLPSVQKIYIAIPPPLVHPPEHPDQPVPFDMDDHVVNDELIVLVPSIAKEFGLKTNTTIGVIDVWSALGGQKGYQNPAMTCDGCHPKKDACTIIARTFASAIAAGR